MKKTETIITSYILAFFWGGVRPEVARRGFDQGDMVMATLRHFRPRIVSEEGSWVLGLLGLPALPRGLLLGQAGSSSSW